MEFKKTTFCKNLKKNLFYPNLNSNHIIHVKIFLFVCLSIDYDNF